MLQSLEIFVDESRSLQQVLGRIADEGKLWEDGDRATGLLGLLCGFQNEIRVVREVTDDWIDLAESKCLNVYH